MKKSLFFIIFGLLYLTSIKPAQGSCLNRLKYFLNHPASSFFRDKVEPWQFSESQEREIQIIFEQETDNPALALQMAAHKLLEMRFEQLNLLIKFSARRAHSKSKPGKRSTINSLLAKYTGPFYHPIFNQIVIDQSEERSPISSLALVHEGTHATQRFTIFPFLIPSMLFDYVHILFARTPITPTLLFMAEAEAMGAQWELFKRVPNKIKWRLLEDLVNQRNPDIEVMNFIQSIVDRLLSNNATYSRTQLRFLRHKRMGALDKQPLNPIALSSRAAKIEAALQKITYASLLFSNDLGKSVFIREVEPYHGYQLVQLFDRHYTKIGLFGWMLAAQAGFIIKKYPPEMWADKIHAIDISLLLRIIGL